MVRENGRDKLIVRFPVTTPNSGWSDVVNWFGHSHTNTNIAATIATGSAAADP